MSANKDCIIFGLLKTFWTIGELIISRIKSGLFKILLTAPPGKDEALAEGKAEAFVELLFPAPEEAVFVEA